MHDVQFSIPARALGKADIEFKVKKGGQRFGTLKVSKGAVVWVQKDNTYGYKMNWNKFHDMMTSMGQHEKGK
jgi:hypothetical protein